MIPATSAPLNPPAHQVATAPPTLPLLKGVEWISKRPDPPVPPPPPEVQSTSSASDKVSVATMVPLNQQEEELLCSDEEEVEERGVKDIDIQLWDPMETNQ